MKALILAAGEGKRLAPHTATKPKTLIKIFGATLLERILDNLLLAGVGKAVIVTGHKNREIETLVGDNHRGVEISYIHNHLYNQTNNIYSVHLSRKKLGNTSFVLINSDVIFHKNILDNLLGKKERGIILSVDLRENLGLEDMKVRIMEDRVVEVSKQIPPKKADGEYIGITRIDKEMSKTFYKKLEEKMSEKGTEVFYEEVFQGLIEENHRIGYEPTRGLPWIEIDTPQDLEQARKKIVPKLLT